MRTYTFAEALSTTNWVELINIKVFVKTALNKIFATFVMHIAALEVPAEISVHLLQVAQIAVLQWDKVSTKVPMKYSDDTDVFSTDLAMKLLENTDINKYVIKLPKGKQPSYGSIYAFSPVELGTLKVYIKTHPKTRFIRPSKSPIGTLILYDKKFDGSFCLYVDFQGPNKLIIKNRYLLPLIGKTLD